MNLYKNSIVDQKCVYIHLNLNNLFYNIEWVFCNIECFIMDNASSNSRIMQL